MKIPKSARTLLAKWGRAGAKARYAKMTPAARSLLARKAVRSRRWRKVIEPGATGGAAGEDRYDEGILGEAKRVLASGRSAARLVARALREAQERPHDDSRACARLAAYVLWQINRFGWETLPENLWDEAERVARDHPGCAARQRNQEYVYLRLANGESIPGKFIP